MENGDTIEDNDAQDLDEEMDNFLGNRYPEVEVDDTYESSGSKDYYSEWVWYYFAFRLVDSAHRDEFVRYSRKRGTSSFDNKYDGIGVDERPRTREDSAFSYFINDTETWLQTADERDNIDSSIDSSDVPDLRTFWKEEGNARNIREARGMSRAEYVSFYLVLSIFYISRKFSLFWSSHYCRRSSDNAEIHG